MDTRPESDMNSGAFQSPARSTMETGQPSVASRVTVTSSFLFFLGVAIGFVALGLLVGNRGLAGLMVAQVVGVLVPSVLFARWARLSWRADLRVVRPAPRALLGAACAGMGTWFVLASTVLWVQNLVIQPSEAFLEQRNALFMSATGPAGWVFVWLGAALVPALTEEFFFRGVLLATLRGKFGDPRGVVVVAALFALFHMNVYQLLVTFILGSILGWLVVRTGSLWTSVVFHLANNTAILVAAGLEGDTLPIPVAVFLVVLLGAGVFLVVRTAPRLEEGVGRIGETSFEGKPPEEGA